MVTAEGVFKIVDRATGPIKGIGRAATDTMGKVKGTGKALDDLDNPKIMASLGNTKREVNNVGQAADKMGAKVKASTDSAGRSFEKMAAKGTASIEVLQLKLKEFEHERSTATLDVNITKAEAKIRLVKEQIRSIQTMQARKELQSLGLIADRATMSLIGGGSGGGGPPGIMGGGMLGGFAGGAIQVAKNVGLMGVALVTALPAIVAITGALSALMGSLGAATMGAGALGIGGLGAGLMGFASIAMIAKPAMTGLKQVTQAQKTYNTAVQQYGDQSRQAIMAHKKLDAAYAASPGTKGLLQNWQAFKKQFQTATAPARRDLFGVMTDGVKMLAKNLGTFAPIINNSLAAFHRAMSTLFASFQSREWRTIFTSMGNTFARGIGPIADALGNIALFFGRIAQAASPVLLQTLQSFDLWTSHLAGRAADTGAMSQKIGGMVSQLKDWIKFFGAAIHLAAAFFGSGARQGQSMLQGITAQLDKWTSWIRTHPAEMQAFFHRTIDAAGKLASAVGKIASALGKMGDMLMPIMNMFTGMVGSLGASGIMTLLEAGGFLYAGRGVGKAFGKGAGRGTAAGGVGAGEAAVGGAVAGGPIRRAYQRFRGRGAPAEAPGMPGEIPAASKVINPATGEPFAAAGEATALGGWAGRAAKVGGVLGKLGRFGLTRVALPLAIAGGITGGLQGYQNYGNVAGTASGAINNLAPFGLGKGATNFFDPGASKVQIDKNARSAYGQITGDLGKLGPQAQLVSINRMLESGNIGMYGDKDLGSGKTRDKAVKSILAQLHPLRQQVAAQVRAMADGIFTDISGAFDITRSKKGPHAALKQMTGQMTDQLKHLGPTGRDELLKASAMWESQLSHGTAADKKIAKSLHDYIVDQYKKMGQKVAVVNGEVLVANHQTWKTIKDDMSTYTEQAAEAVSKNLTDIQKKAMAVMVAMGFKPGDAEKIIKGAEPGNKNAQTRQASQNVMANPKPGSYESGIATGQKSGPASTKARGGRVGGFGLVDHVPFGDAIAAPGELLVNRHTERKLDMELGMLGATERLVNNEAWPHSGSPHHAKGGRLGANKRGGVRGAGIWGGHPALSGPIADAVSVVLKQFPGLAVTSTTDHSLRSTSGGISWHSKGKAADVAGAPALMLQAADWIGKNLGSSLEEGIHNPNLSIKGGKRVPSGFWGGAVWGQHINHIHMAVTAALGALGAGALGAGGFGGGGMPQVSPDQLMPKHASKQKGLAGALTDRVSEITSAAYAARINKAAAKMGGGDLSGFAGQGGSNAANRALGKQMMMAAGWPASEWPALNALWNQESGWSSTAVNKSSGAYGIPQALGHGHPFNLGDAGSQIAWGLNYIRGRYGSPSKAEAHEKAFNWYSLGGRLPSFAGAFAGGGAFTTAGPTMALAGERTGRARERVTITPLNTHRAGPGNLGGGGGKKPPLIPIHIEHLHNHEPGDIEEILQRELSAVASGLNHGPDDDEIGDELG